MKLEPMIQSEVSQKEKHQYSSHYSHMASEISKKKKTKKTFFLVTPHDKSLQMVTAAMKLKDAYSLEEKL